MGRIYLLLFIIFAILAISCEKKPLIDDTLLEEQELLFESFDAIEDGANKQTSDKDVK